MTSATTNVTIVPFAEIQEPGTYVCNWNGHLLQVPAGAIAPGGVPWVSFYAIEPLEVTKISDDATIPVDEARCLAANLEVFVGF